MITKSAGTFRDALFGMAESYPDSLLAELLVNFEIGVVAKLIQIYGGQAFQIPRKENVWRDYRDKLVRKTLDLKNDRITRKELAQLFGVSYPYVSAIYRKEKEKYPEASFMKIDALVREIYKRRHEALYKEMTELFSRKL